MVSFVNVRKNVADTRPLMRFDSGNFSEYRKKAQAKLKELLGINEIKPAEDLKYHVEWEKERATYIETRFSFESEKGEVIPCHILVPKGIEKPVPVICIQGHSKGMYLSLGEQRYKGDKEKIELGDRDFAIRTVNEGCAAITIEQRYMGERGGDENGPGCLNHNLAMPALLIGRTAIGERVWDVSRLIDVLFEKFGEQLKLEELICLGNSGGGTTTFYAACLDERIKTAVPSCSVCTFKDSIAAMKHCCCNYIPNIGKYFDMGDLGGLIAPRNLVVVAGNEDNIFPIKGVREAYAQTENLFMEAGCIEKCHLIIGNGGHRFYADEAWKEIHKIIH